MKHARIIHFVGVKVMNKLCFRRYPCFWSKKSIFEIFKSFPKRVSQRKAQRIENCFYVWGR